jgi:predicted metal-dependent enzyme (double-stranded beta helix superfamily)
MFSVNQFVESCRNALGESNPPARIQAEMERVLEDPQAVSEAFDNSITRATDMAELMLYRSDDLMIHRVALDPHWKSLPHDHRIWGFVGIYQGEEANTFYREHDGHLEQTGSRTVKAGKVLAMDPGIIHSIANPVGSTTIGIHVYLGDLQKQKRHLWNPVTHAKEVFDLDRFFALERRLNGDGP